ncbi:MAG: hypothetical protein FWD16_01615, partial [Clostridia bacterium]|nr:hypothetical protein [Clostridia bacterium]
MYKSLFNTPCRRAAAWLLSIAMVLAMVPFAASATGGTLAGSGTSASPWEIADETDLIAMRTNTAYASSGKFFKLTKDITLSATWTPFGFSGNFNGQGFAIKNLVVDMPTTNGIGLFSTVGSTGMVQNLRVETGQIGSAVGITGNANVGGIAGNMNAGKIQNCTVKGLIVSAATTGNANLGGIVGYYNNAASVTECVSLTDLQANVGYVGGIFGATASGCVTQRCAWVGTVLKSGSMVGGIGGDNYGGRVTDCYSGGVIVPNAGWCAGIIGRNCNGSPKIENCVSNTAITSTGSYVGGIAGESGGATVVNNYYNLDRMTLKTAGGNGITATGLSGSSFFGSLEDFEGLDKNIWGIDEDTFPYLKWQKTQAGVSNDTTPASYNYTHGAASGTVTATGAVTPVDVNGTEPIVKITGVVTGGHATSVTLNMVNDDTPYIGTIICAAPSGLSAPYIVTAVRNRVNAGLGTGDTEDDPIIWDVTAATSYLDAQHGKYYKVVGAKAMGTSTNGCIYVRDGRTAYITLSNINLTFGGSGAGIVNVQPGGTAYVKLVGENRMVRAAIDNEGPFLGVNRSVDGAKMGTLFLDGPGSLYCEGGSRNHAQIGGFFATPCGRIVINGGDYKMRIFSDGPCIGGNDPQVEINGGKFDLANRDDGYRNGALIGSSFYSYAKYSDNTGVTPPGGHGNGIITINGGEITAVS